MDSSQAVLELVNVTRRYESPPVVPLHNASLAISPGESIAITGKSGSGKSTLLNIMGTLDRPSEGELRILGNPTSSLADHELAALRSRYIGFVFQQAILVETMTALDNAAMGLLYQGVSASTRRARAAEVLDLVGLSHRSEYDCRKLSGGERQRVVIARALISDPALILADEPTGSLDSQTTDQVLDVLAGLHRQGCAVVVVTHDPEVTARFQRQIDLADGQVVSDRTHERSAL